MANVRVTCSGCGAVVAADARLAFRCPNAAEDDGIDHVLVRRLGGPEVAFPEPAAALADQNPFIRYRRLLLGYHLARRHGLADADFCGLVEDLDSAIARVDGRGFRVTPFAPQPALASAIGMPADGQLWIKDETANVSGSHKARHLMGVMIYLKVLERTGLPVADGLRARRLAIASCGNAALAAAVIARAADWPLDVFIPTDAEAPVVTRLKDLGATCHVMERQAGQPGDPCYHGFRRAVAEGSLPFGVQGNEVGLAIEGGHTLGWEMADVLRTAGTDLDLLVVQVGGGALGSACYQGLKEAQAFGALARLPAIFTVQTMGAYPLKQAFTRFAGEANPNDLAGSLRHAARNRADYMKPWPATPHSVAHGILDDETYDWLALVEAMAVTDGDARIVGEPRLIEAHGLGREAAGIAVSHTGAAGLAGLIDLAAVGLPEGVRAAVLFTGAERN
jgi:threonine synthase